MTEQERLLVVERINKDKNNIELRKEKNNKKEELEQLKEVKEYLETIEEIKELNNKLSLFDTEEKMIDLEFTWAFRSRIKAGKIKPCKHEIWMYKGSYTTKEDYYSEHDYICLVDDESSKDFEFNEYICLECGKTLKVENWNGFEKDNFVLKNREDIDYEKYINLYYQSLYTNTVSESRKIVVEEFKDNLIKTLEKEYNDKKNKILQIKI